MLTRCDTEDGGELETKAKKTKERKEEEEEEEEEEESRCCARALEAGR